MYSLLQLYKISACQHSSGFKSVFQRKKLTAPLVSGAKTSSQQRLPVQVAAAPLRSWGLTAQHSLPGLSPPSQVAEGRHGRASRSSRAHSTTLMTAAGPTQPADALTPSRHGSAARGHRAQPPPGPARTRAAAERGLSVGRGASQPVSRCLWAWARLPTSGSCFARLATGLAGR